jgi:aerobic-type carbon monoxide dehydrogenase small subunit (CoxS/CutS family)
VETTGLTVNGKAVELKINPTTPLLGNVRRCCEVMQIFDKSLAGL